MTATQSQLAESLAVYGVALARLDREVDVEADLYTPTTNLIASLGGDEVRVSSEHSTFVGRPDLMVSRERRECVVGWVELKNMDSSADPRRLTSSHDRNQWERFQALPNLVYSNGYEATLWRDGVQVGELASQSSDEAWGVLWEEFLSYTPTVDPRPVPFAVTMARRVRLLRDVVEEAFDGGSDHLRDTLELWRDHLLAGSDGEEVYRRLRPDANGWVAACPGPPSGCFVLHIRDVNCPGHSPEPWLWRIGGTTAPCRHGSRS